MRCLSTKGGECSVFTFQCFALAKSALRVGTVSDPNEFSIFWSRNLFIFSLIWSSGVIAGSVS
jgi:hypothetical protein